MDKNSIFAKRLKNARVMRGYSMDDLVREINYDVSKTTISKFENGSLTPRKTILLSIATALNLPLDYFFRPFSINIHSIQIRGYKINLKKKQENALKEKISDFIERYNNIEEICNATVDYVSPVAEVMANREDVKNATKKIRKKWNITEGIFNVIELLEEHGIKVMETDAPKSFQGLCSLVNNAYSVIVLNNGYTTERKRFAALREFGRIILKFDENLSPDEVESLCNFFANEMLISEESFKREIGEKRLNISYQELKAIQFKYGISCDSLMYKAKICNIISEKRYKTFCSMKSKKLALKTLIEDSIYPKEQSYRFESLVYKALSNDLITLTKAAELLQQNIEKVSENLAIACPKKN